MNGRADDMGETPEVDLANFADAEPWEYANACREAYWGRYGTSDGTAFFGPTNGPLSPWPGKAENFVPIHLAESTVITTSGMSSPWDWENWSEGDGDRGEGLEYYIDSPRLAGATIEDIAGSWELRLLIFVVQNYAGQDYRPTFDYYDCITVRIPVIEELADWADDAGHLCLLLGAPSGVREDYIEMFGDRRAVRLISVTPVHPDELDWVTRAGVGNRGALGWALAASPYRNQIHPERPSLLGTVDSFLSD